MSRQDREEDYTEGLGGISIPSAEDLVVQFVQGNPNASLEDIASLIQTTGADLGSVASTLGVPMAEAQRAFDTAIGVQTPAQTAAAEAQAAASTAQQEAIQAAKDQVEELKQNRDSGLQKVKDYISSGQAKNDNDIYREMVKNDVSVEAMAGQLGVPVDEATDRYTRAQELSQIEDIVSGGIEQSKKEFPNGIPDNLLKRYATESGQSLEQIATNMDNFGVSVTICLAPQAFLWLKFKAHTRRLKAAALQPQVQELETQEQIPIK
jgi:hypothetical protein